MALESSLRHQARRKQIEQERAERRAAEEERKRKASQKKKSSSIPAKWYWKGGIKIGGTPVKRFIYAGANIKTLNCPNIPEPSLLNPVEKIHDSAEGAERLGEYPMYQYLSPEQRRGYIDFLAGARDVADDIGYVFLYLYGFERRLVIDAAKPDEVSAEEREDIVGELLRLLQVFGDRSRSLAHYIAMLLLYDGTVFEMLSPEALLELFAATCQSNDTYIRSRELCDNADAMSYLIISRYLSKRMKMPQRDLLAAAKGRLLRGSNAAMLGITAPELYTEELEQLVLDRLSHCDFSRLKSSAGKSITSPIRPVYYPASPMLRKQKRLEITSNIAADPEQMSAPLKAVADMLVQGKNDLDECRAVLSTSSLRDIGKVKLDALSVVAKKQYPLAQFLEGRTGAIYVPVSVLKEELRQRFNTPLSYTSKGVLSLSSQQLIAASAATLGWQAMLPDVVEGVISSFWRIDEDSRIVMFERKVEYNKRNGVREIAPVFGGDETTYELVIPGAWLQSSVLLYIYAWFVDRCGDALDKSVLTHFSSAYYPAFSTASGNKKNQIAFFFSLLHATYSLKLSTHGIKKCLEMADFSAVQQLVFSLCDERFGKVLPPDVLVALEDLYKKAGRDCSLVLYDYHAGTYNSAHIESSGFSIDEEKLADTLADTTSVQDMLNEAMMEADDFVDEEPAAEESSPDTKQAETIDANRHQEDDTDSTNEILECVETVFGDGDEASTSDVLDAIVSSGYAATSAEAMSVIAKINDTAGEELVEIDGADCYWNG